MTKLTHAQKLMMARLARNAAKGERTPFVGGRSAGRIAAAWYRTADSLKRLGLIVLCRTGDAETAWLPEFAPNDLVAKP